MKLPKLKIIGLVGSLLRKLGPIEIAGGLAISDSALRYYRLGGNGSFAAKASLRLPPGAVIGGKIGDKNTIIAALKQLRNMVDVSLSRKAEVIISIGSGAIYSQIFNLPQLEESALDEAADLNIQMISPINIKNAYYSYQVVGSPGQEGNGGYELLGAFINSSVVDEWLPIIKESGFMPIAVEFQALSVARAATELAGIKKNEIALIVSVLSEGINLIILKNGNLYFDYFYPWKIIQGEDKSISMDKFKQIIVAETGKVMNFSLSKFGGEIKSAWINADSVGEDIISALKGHYPSLPVFEISFGEGKKISSAWLPAMGAAKRGMLLRSEDNLISLTPLNVVEEYREEQIIFMIKIWRRIFVISLCFFLFIFSLSDLFLRQVRISIGQQYLRELSPAEATEFGKLRGEAEKFNSLVSLVGEAKKQENKVYPFISKVSNLGGDIKLTRFSIQDFNQPVIINGDAPSADSVIRFQKRLADISNVTDIRFPLSSLISAPGGRTAFTMSFRITSLNID